MPTKINRVESFSLVPLAVLPPEVVFWGDKISSTTKLLT